MSHRDQRIRSAPARTDENADQPQPEVPRLPIRRNVALLSAALTGLTLLGGLALSAVGVAALAIGAMTLVAAPALWILRAGSAQRHPVHLTTDLRRTPCSRT